MLQWKGLHFWLTECQAKEGGESRRLLPIPLEQNENYQNALSSIQNYNQNNLNSALNGMNNLYNISNGYSANALLASNATNNFNQQNYINAMNAYTAQQAQKNAMWGSMGNAFSGIGSGLGTIGGALIMSDKNTKKNIKKIGEKNGINIYEFEYKPEYQQPKGKHIGVIAQEVEHIPNAVIEKDGIKYVDYTVINKLIA